MAGDHPNSQNVLVLGAKQNTQRLRTGRDGVILDGLVGVLGNVLVLGAEEDHHRENFFTKMTPSRGPRWCHSGWPGGR